MVAQFQIPLSRNDLLSSYGEYYVVKEVYSVREIGPKLEESLNNLNENGPTGISSEFDSIFSVIIHFNEVAIELKEKAWNSICKAFSQHINELSIIIDPEGMDFRVQKTHLCTVKMLSYLLAQLMESFEAQATKPSITTDEGRKGRGRQAAKKTSPSGWDWDQERNDGLRVIGQLIELDIHRLWDPPVIEEDFVNIFTSLCYKFLENTAVVKLKETKDMVFHILGVLIKKYDHGLSASLKIIQLLQHFEHLVVPLAQAVEVFVVQFGSQRIVADIIREIGRMDSADLSRDSSGTRSFSQFIVELAGKQPSLVLPSISLLLSHLDGDSYSMRNGVLSVIGELIIKILSRDDLDPNLKNTRDKFLDRLEEHLHDVHAFVRSKVLQIWHNLCTQKAIPLSRQGQLLELVIGRLHDKSSQVRKYAVQLVKEFLIGNPFGAKLPIDELKMKLEKEKEKLDKILSEHSNQVEQVDKWMEIAPHLFEALKEGNGEVTDCSLTIEEDAEIAQVIENVLTTLYKNLVTGKYKEAIAVYRFAEMRWPEHFCASETSENDEENCNKPKENGQDSAKDEEEGSNGNLEKEIRVKMTLFEAIYRKFDDETQKLDDEEAHDDDKESSNEPEELKKQRIVVNYLEDSVRFACQMQNAIKVLSQLLGSKTSSDILETVDFFVSANEFNLADIELGTRKMLALVWSRDTAVREAVVNAYRKLYIEPKQENDKNMAQTVTQNLTTLTYGATLGELTSLEELLKEIYKMDLIPQKVLQLLWQRFSLKGPQTSPQESRSAVLLLGMFAGAETSIIKSNIDILISNGLGPRAHEDFLLAFNTCTALLKLTARKKKPGESEEEPFRFPEDHVIFGRLENILVTGLQKTEVSSWSGLALQAINVIYKLAEHPDKLCGRLIKNLTRDVLIDPTGSKATSFSNKTNPDEDSSESSPSQDAVNAQNSQSVAPMFSCQPKVLARVLFVVGHVAFQQMAHLDVSILSELKRRHRIQEEEKEKKQGGKGENKDSHPVDGETSKEHAEEGLEDDLGVGGAAAEDAEAEFIRNVCEKDIVTGQNLLALFGPLLTAICSNPTKYSDEELRASACLALPKFMLVSSEFCESNLQLLFTILEKSKEPTIRANTIIALGDLTFRFPNLIEPWTSHLYGRLSDESVKVRQTTVTVLTHLILNDMVKVKGQISEMAFCLEDQERRIADLAKLFFTEFSHKGNALYNVLPDIISRLSDPESGTDEEKFHRIMEYLLQFIQKDKQAEALVEKLCHRFRVTSTQRQWHDLVYCLSQLPFNEKCFKKLQENFACFQESLSDNEVFDCFNNIISKAKKFIKQDLKVIIEEFEEKLIACHNKAVDDEAGFQRVAKASQKAGARKSKQKINAGEPKRRTRLQTRDDSEGSEDDKENWDFKTPRRGKRLPASKSTKRRKATKKPLKIIEDESDDDIDLFAV